MPGPTYHMRVPLTANTILDSTLDSAVMDRIRAAIAQFELGGATVYQVDLDITIRTV